MIKQIVSKMNDNNYEKVYPYNFGTLRKTTFIDVEKLTIGVCNRNKSVEKYGIQELLDNAKLE